MSVTFGDLAPALVGVIAAIVGLGLIWHAVRQAHSPPRGPNRPKDEAAE